MGLWNNNLTSSRNWTRIHTQAVTKVKLYFFRHSEQEKSQKLNNLVKTFIIQNSLNKYPLKEHWQRSKKRCFKKILFMWSSMPVFSFLVYTQTGLFRKPDNWWQIYKQTSSTFYPSNVCREEMLVRHIY